MTTMTRMSTSVVACMALALVSSSAAFASDRANRCVSSKNKGAVKAFACITKANTKILLGGTADVGACGGKLSRAFSRAESRGTCPINGDYAAVQQRLDDTEVAVFAALDAGGAGTDAAKRCVAAKSIAAARYASCVANLVEKPLKGQYVVRFGSPAEKIAACGDRIVVDFQKAEDKGGCAGGGLAADIAGIVSAAGTNLAAADLTAPLGLALPGMPFAAANLAGGNLARIDLTEANLRSADLSAADLTSARLSAARLSDANLANANLTSAQLDNSSLIAADLTNANVSGANLSFANLSVADLTNATMLNVQWHQTVCPDLSRSDTNGSSPESCCANLNGKVAAGCSP